MPESLDGNMNTLTSSPLAYFGLALETGQGAHGQNTPLIAASERADMLKALPKALKEAR